MTNKRTGTHSVDSLSGVPRQHSLRFNQRSTPLPARNVNQPQTQSVTPTAESAQVSKKSAAHSKKNGSKTISFELKLPHVKKPRLPKIHMPFPSNRRTAMPTAAVGFVLLLIAGAVGINHLNKSSGTLGSNTEIKQTAPTFETLAPPEKEVKEQPVSYDEEKGVASFAHKIGDTDVTVSQQPLPNSFKTNPDREVENLAKSLKASRVITAGEVKAYSGFSSEDGSQTVLFTKNKLLIFIRAQKAIKDDALAQYILSLR